MTNSEINQQIAIKAKEANLLTKKEFDFVKDIESLNKKELKKLTSKQYKFIRDIADKYCNEIN